MLQQIAQSLVPAGYAEKAMASLMRLHTELMDEKERRVDLYRRLMEKEQALAELRMYAAMLEEKLSAQAQRPASGESNSERARSSEVHPNGRRTGVSEWKAW